MTSDVGYYRFLGGLLHFYWIYYFKKPSVVIWWMKRGGGHNVDCKSIQVNFYFHWIKDKIQWTKSHPMPRHLCRWEQGIKRAILLYPVGETHTAQNERRPQTNKQWNMFPNSIATQSANAHRQTIEWIKRLHTSPKNGFYCITRAILICRSHNYTIFYSMEILANKSKYIHKSLKTFQLKFTLVQWTSLRPQFARAIQLEHKSRISKRGLYGIVF